MQGRTIIDHGRWNDGTDNLALDNGAKICSRDIIGMLGGDDDGVNSEGDNRPSLEAIFDGDLGLCVWTKKGHGAISAGTSECSIQVVRQDASERHT